MPGPSRPRCRSPEPATTAELLQQVRSGHRTDCDAVLALLAELPIAATAESLAAPEATDEHGAGAVRHLVGWRARKRLTGDIASLSPEIRARVVAVGQQSPGSAIRSRSADHRA